MSSRSRTVCKTLFPLLPLLALWPVHAPAAAPAAVAAPNPVIEWNALAAEMGVDVSKKFAGQSIVDLAIVQLAVYDAAAAVSGTYEPFAIRAQLSPEASLDAAVASAAYHAILGVLPKLPEDAKAKLARAHATGLAQIADGAARDAGDRLGAAVAEAWLALRSRDGRDADLPYQSRQGPGAWTLTPDSPATAPQTPWLARVQPFSIHSPDAFRPAPPPPVDGTVAKTDLDEVRRVGAKESAERTADQARAAQFWSFNATTQTSISLRALATRRGLSTMETARLFAATSSALADSMIACLDAKYAYGYWRPITAIRANGEASWTPLLVTPNHPEYPAAHGCWTATAVTVLRSLLGSDSVPHDWFTPKGEARHFQRFSDVLREVEGARIWGGLHYRNSFRVGAQMGQRIAEAVVRENFKRRAALGDTRSASR